MQIVDNLNIFYFSINLSIILYRVFGTPMFVAAKSDFNYFRNREPLTHAEEEIDDDTENIFTNVGNEMTKADDKKLL